VRLGDCDVYLNVAGGLRIGEPAADLAVAAALVSSRLNAALPADCVYFGEISLSGSIRPVSHATARLKEAQKLGFGRAVLPSAASTGELSGTGLRGIGQLVELVAGIAATARGRRGDGDGADD
jgi:DNA repair protein RadA/Sms